MAVLLGVDTGGTYTDAVLLRDEADVLASAKALTTREDLALGVGAAIRAVLDDSGIAAAEAAHNVGKANMFGVKAAKPEIDGAAVMARVRSERDRFVGFVKEALECGLEAEAVRYVGALVFAAVVTACCVTLA